LALRARCRELLDMPAPEPPASEVSKDYSERYEELTGSSSWECPVCHRGRMLVIEILPRNPHRRVTPIKNTIMMERTAFGSRSNCAAQAWPGQATGAALPNGSSRRNLRHRSHSPDTVIALYAPRSHKASHALITSGYIGPSPEIRRTINTNPLLDRRSGRAS